MVFESPVLIVADAAAWRIWLLQNHADSPGTWLSMAKKGVTDPTSLTMDEAIEEALCFGWINGQARKGDEKTICQRWTRRKPKSAWSKRNVAFVAKLEEQGRMQEAGRAAVDAAKADGRWDAAYSGSANDEDMADFLEALRVSPAAEEAWKKLKKSDRSAFYFRLMMLRTPAGREKRIRAFVDELARGADTPATQMQKAKPAASKVMKSRRRPAGTTSATATSTTRARSTRSGRNAPTSYIGKD